MTCKHINTIDIMPSSHQSNPIQQMATNDSNMTLLPKRSCSRAVRFASSSNDSKSVVVTVHTITSIAERGHSHIWYKHNEIESFKTDARKLISAIQIQKNAQKQCFSNCTIQNIVFKRLGAMDRY